MAKNVKGTSARLTVPFHLGDGVKLDTALVQTGIGGPDYCAGLFELTTNGQRIWFRQHRSNLPYGCVGPDKVVERALTEEEAGELKINGRADLLSKEDAVLLARVLLEMASKMSDED